MIYFDNSATSYPKPRIVMERSFWATKNLGGNPGRSGHKMSIKSSEEIYKVREKLARFFDAEPENVVFTLNCTYALNMAIKGIMLTGGEMIISGMEHNSVSRPAYWLSKYAGVKVNIAEIGETKEETFENFKSKINKNTKCIVCMTASNVTGEIMPYKELGKLCKEKGICFIGDAAQGSGVLPLSMNEGFDILCMSGHKGLLGLTGTGVLISNSKYNLKTIIEGGNGATSTELEQTSFLPERLESGTLNVAGIVSLGAGIDYLEKVGLKRIKTEEERLCDIFINEMKYIKGVRVIREEKKSYVPIVAFELENISSFEAATLLSDKGFALRGGIHCSALAHKTLGTSEKGLLRFSPSVFNRPDEVKKLAKIIKNL